MDWELVSQCLGVIGGLGVIGQFVGWIRRRFLEEEGGRLVLGVQRDPTRPLATVTAEWVGLGQCWNVAFVGADGADPVAASRPQAAHLSAGEGVSMTFVITALPASVTVRYRVHNSKRPRMQCIDLNTGDVWLVQGPRSWRATGLPS
ncbi:MAG: hypothetical protein E6423_17425 [Clostridium sp.]|nr:hypothetical protein [Clostridium sp.]